MFSFLLDSGNHFRSSISVALKIRRSIIYMATIDLVIFFVLIFLNDFVSLIMFMFRAFAFVIIDNRADTVHFVHASPPKTVTPYSQPIDNLMSFLSLCYHIKSINILTMAYFQFYMHSNRYPCSTSVKCLGFQGEIDFNAFNATIHGFHRWKYISPFIMADTIPWTWG